MQSSEKQFWNAQFLSEKQHFEMYIVKIKAKNILNHMNFPKNVKFLTL